MPNLLETARELALAWIACDQWGEPTCSESYEKFFLDETKCSEDLADALIIKRADLIIVRTLASKQVARTRRMMAATNGWAKAIEEVQKRRRDDDGIDYGEDGIDIPDFIRECRRRMAEGGGA